MNCEPGDPALRLGIIISGFTKAGEPTCFWAENNGPQVAVYANTIVDWLECVPLSEIAKRPRRYIHKDRIKFLQKQKRKEELRQEKD